LWIRKILDFISLNCSACYLMSICKHPLLWTLTSIWTTRLNPILKARERKKVCFEVMQNEICISNEIQALMALKKKTWDQNKLKSFCFCCCGAATFFRRTCFRHDIFSTDKIYTCKAKLWSSKAQICTSKVNINTSRVENNSNKFEINTGKVEIYSSRAQLCTSKVQIYSRRAQLSTSKVKICTS